MRRFQNRSLLIVILMAFVLFGSASCKPEVVDPNEGEIMGCKDIDSPNFNIAATMDDGSCEYLYVVEYELTNHQADDWDPVINTDADVYFRVKRQSSIIWDFSSNTLDNVGANSIQYWSAPEQFQLKNQYYSWELWDADTPPIDADDLIASGTFNPVQDGNDGVVVSMSSDGMTTIKIHYAQY